MSTACVQYMHFIGFTVVTQASNGTWAGGAQGLQCFKAILKSLLLAIEAFSQFFLNLQYYLLPPSFVYTTRRL